MLRYLKDQIDIRRSHNILTESRLKGILLHQTLGKTLDLWILWIFLARAGWDWGGVSATSEASP